MKLSRIVFLICAVMSTNLMGAYNGGGGAIASENIVRLVFMGKSGAGKSTTVNAFYNFAKRTSWDTYPKHFPIKTPYQQCNVAGYENRRTEDHSKKQLKAVTQSPSEYSSTGDNLVLNLIDCPGMADPEGIDRDMEITKDIAAFLNKAGEFNAICIVVPCTVNRETTEESYLIEQVKSVIPKSAYDRIFLVVTNTTRVSTNVKEFASSFGLPTDNIFAFNHLALSEDGHLPILPVGDGGDEELADDVKSNWRSGQNNFDRLIKSAKSLGKYSTKEIARISEIKAKTMEKIFDAQRKIDAIEKHDTRLKTAQKISQQADDEYAAAEGFVNSALALLAKAKAQKEVADALEATETYELTKLVDADKHSTMCMHCGVFCHEECGLEYKGDNCTDHLSGCHCMKDGSCTQCPNKCDTSFHRHRMKKFVTETHTRDKEDVMTKQSDAASTFMEESSNVENKQNDLELKLQERDQEQEKFEELKSKLSQLKAEKEAIQKDIVNLYLELEKVSMGSINLHICEYYDKAISKEKDPAKKIKLEKDRTFYTEQVELYNQMKKK